MAKKKRGRSISVHSTQHKDKRKNIPTEELRDFVKEDNIFRIKKEIREMLIFAPQNVIKDPPFTKLDLICCRNLLIYLDAVAAALKGQRRGFVELKLHAAQRPCPLAAGLLDFDTPEELVMAQFFQFDCFQIDATVGNRRIGRPGRQGRALLGNPLAAQQPDNAANYPEDQ